MLTVLVLSLGLAGSCNKAGSGTATSSGAGSSAVSATAFNFTTRAGAVESSSQYLGKPLVVNFWADW